MRRGRKTSAEQVVLRLRRIEVQTAQGKSLVLACREAEISEQSCCRWRKEYGGGAQMGRQDRAADPVHRTRLAVEERVLRELQRQAARQCLRQEIVYSLKEAQIVNALWQSTYNRVRPHSSSGYRPPAPVSFPDLAFRLPMAAAMQ